MTTTFEEQLVEYLADAHSIEEQALQQLRCAPKAAGDPQLAALFQDHLAETDGHERAMRARLEAHGEDPSLVKDLLLRAGGAGFLLFARAQPDTPGKLVAHAFSFEHLELASYELLGRVAERAGDEKTAEAARSIRDEERRMADRLSAAFDRAVDASLEALGPDDLGEQLDSYLADAHAIEVQAGRLLEQAPGAAGDPGLASLYAAHLDETREHESLVDTRLEARGSSSSALKDAALRSGALSWATFFELHPDTPSKLAAFAYAFEHLEIAAYEELRRVAERAGDAETVAAAERILGEERAAVARIAASFDRATEASLRDVVAR
jgi:ferritin-like metal-binding protein YciE